MKGIKLIVFDLDGTVVDHGKNISAYTVNVLRRCHEKGCLIAVSSGRCAAMIPPAVTRLPFLDYLITSNGARIRCMKDGTVLHHVFMERQYVWDVLEAAKNREAFFNVFFEDSAVFGKKGAGYILAAAHSISLTALRQLLFLRGRVRRVTSIQTELIRHAAQIEKMGCVFSKSSDCIEVLRALRQHPGLETVQTMENELEITACGVSKGTALIALRHFLQISAENTVAFGDGGNDLSMKGAAGYLVAMGNAIPELLDRADFITGTVQENGVAQWIEQHMEE